MADDSSSCCPPGSLPALQEDTARELSGELVNDKLYYSAPPSASTKGILVIYDVFGFSGGRIKSVCDQLALAGSQRELGYNGAPVGWADGPLDLRGMV